MPRTATPKTDTDRVVALAKLGEIITRAVKESGLLNKPIRRRRKKKDGEDGEEQPKKKRSKKAKKKAKKERPTPPADSDQDE